MRDADNSMARRFALAAFCLSAVLGTATCDLTAPRWEASVILPFNSDTIVFEDVLPAGVITGDIGGKLTFIVSAISDSTNATLAEVCGSACRALHGQSTPVPGFSYVDTLDIELTSDLLLMDVDNGLLNYRIEHEFEFDPLRPNSDPALAGSITLATFALSTGELLDSTMISGASTALPPGIALTGFIDLSGKQVAGGTRTVLRLDSPFDGQTAIIDTTASFSAGGLLEGLLVGGIRVVLDSDTLRESFPVDLPPEVRERFNEALLPGFTQVVQAAKLVIEIRHDLTISGELITELSNGADELQFEDIDFSTAPNGRTVEREIAPADFNLIAEAETLTAAYTAVVTGTGSGQSVRLIPGDGVLIKLTISARLLVQP